MSSLYVGHSEIMHDMIGPSLLSLDPNERKMARKLRIQRRLDALTKQKHPEGEDVIEVTPVERQILNSVEVLEKVIQEGNEVVTGVAIANDARELERRKEVQATRERLLAVLEEEDKKCLEKYHEIKQKWPDILKSNDPLDIHDELQAQNIKCLEIIDRKDALIVQLKEELENTDLKYAEDIEKQNEDIDLLIERMENQIQVMARAYRQELKLIEDVAESERKMLIQFSVDRRETLFKKLKNDTFEAKEKRKEIMKEYEKEMEKAMIEHQEKFRLQKISFEWEIQNLQQEVQNMKAVCMMNVEKLDYNYAILKRREEENIIVKNQQKRRINRLQDVINELKKTYTDLEESTRSEIQKLTSQILKSHKAILDMEEKSNYLATINDRKYMQIWDLNIKTANELVNKILTADRIIHEQLLGLDWEPPSEKLLKKEDLPSYCGAMCLLKKEKEEAERRKILSKSYKPATTLEDINVERRLLNHILKLVSDECDYLIEDTLQELLSNYSENDKLLIRLDKIFEALKVTSEQELQYLLNFFLPYAYCRTCTSKPTNTGTVCGLSDKATESSSSVTPVPKVCGEDFHLEESKLIAAVQGALCCEKCNDNDTVVTSDISEEEEASLETPPMDEQIVSTCVPEGIVEIQDETGEAKRQLVCDKGHLLTVEAKFVSSALKEFVQRYEFVKKEKASKGDRVQLKGKVTVSRSISEKDITEFWERYQKIFPEDKERLWDNLLFGLKKYYEVLKERHKLNAEVEFLRKQNAELRYFLRSSTNEVKPSNSAEEEFHIFQEIL